MFAERFITEEEREEIKKNKLKEKEINQYQFEAVGRMKNIESNWRVKNYKDKY